MSRFKKFKFSFDLSMNRKEFVKKLNILWANNWNIFDSML
jgi:hypothetical protein